MWKGKLKSRAILTVAIYWFLTVFEIHRKKTFNEEDEEEEDTPVEEETFAAFALTLCRNVTATTASIIASQPFHVIAVRTMAQFIGQEQKYT